MLDRQKSTCLPNNVCPSGQGLTVPSKELVFCERQPVELENMAAAGELLGVGLIGMSCCRSPLYIILCYLMLSYINIRNAFSVELVSSAEKVTLITGLVLKH